MDSKAAALAFEQRFEAIFTHGETLPMAPEPPP
jgi:hypothetical protein